jgi:cellulose synthase/poly-beta-1,6-N-acetylglucosamine synthase-like glycosyltransferase
MMDVSVIVPAYNAAATVGACLQALASQSLPGRSYEVIVMDDGSSDMTREIVGLYDVRLIEQPHKGPAAARNRGVMEANGEIVLFTDADCEPTKNWISEMVAPFELLEVVGVKGAYRTRQRGIIPRFVQCEYEERYERMAKRRRIDFIDTYSAGYRREVFLREKGFDVRYPSASVEDQEFSFRLAERGYKMVFNPRAVVYHQHPETLAAYFGRKFNIGYWKLMVLERHPRKSVGDAHTPQSLKVQMGVVVLLIPVVALALLSGLMLPAFVVVFSFLVSVLPFTVKALLRDPLVGVVSPPLLFVRSVALILGLMKGCWDFLLYRVPATRDA